MMQDIKYIYNIQKTTLPMDRDTLLDCINNSPIFGYIYCRYDELLNYIKRINSASEIDLSKNPNKIFSEINDPEGTPEVVFKIEGYKKNNDHYIDTVLKNNDMETWTDFSTYSSFMKEEILNMKEKLFKKILWKYENIHYWFLSGDIKLSSNVEAEYAKNWESFRDDVVNTEDLESFIHSCSENDKENYKKFLIKNAKKLLVKYKYELMKRVDVADKKQEVTSLEKPIINKIFIVSNKYTQCKNDFPNLNVLSLSTRNFNLVGII